MAFKLVRAAATVAGLTFATGAMASECIAPAGPGGGWDFTCRQVGKMLQDLKLIDETMQVTNLEGGGGGVAFAEVVNKRGDANDLIVAASSATATRLAQGAYPGNTMDQVRWLAAVGADYGVIAVSANSPIQTLPELLEQIKTDPTSVSVAGGSAVGGWDHLKVLIAANAFGIDDVRTVKYIAFDGGGEAVTQLLAGSVQAFTGDISEAKGFVDSGDIRVIAVLAPERLPGAFADFPTAKEQGVDAIGANWRGFYAPGGMTDAAYNTWVEDIGALYASDEWKTVMAANGLAPLDLQGAAFEEFVASSVAQIQQISKEIGILR
ncbi:putative tricarboxylic transport membrane protein [Rhodobacter aestuarii]|uniref:Putative tricarboxylic transport membrane protein n=1 Tax=Rhodobacter aestuarii TaxID=453582 RepID=A0A1N7MRK9_9RHOB|nr:MULTISPECIES: tripartite tricarboxylate transporter substrate-binding protein [Rhodobacter]PTV96586.1 putative tricarboxylic transport membrane protein [Rhodobacter aestuarii]SIS88700.1 putative tricarboxylic transport membrane protein [Rhodobacter aestuarii]SOB91387.1 putative tricarboxylic transport membrane protein [Rhodobacter sp. JA431]